MSKVLYEKRDRIAYVTINRPDARNAIDPEVHRLMIETWADFRDDDSVDVAILTGAGEAFCAGADLKTYIPPIMAEASPRDIREIVELGLNGFTRGMHRIPKPIIGAVNGWALAGGLETAMACDILYCTPDARFGEPEIRFGSGPVTLLMPYVLGQRMTRELLLTGDTIDAEEALRIGLVNRIVPAEDMDAEVSRLIARIAPTPLQVLKLTKIALNRAYLCMGLAEAVEANLDLSAMLNGAGAPEQVEFDRITRESGLRAALAWRDERYGEVLGALGHEEE
jgi:enoyl-CoA hydratase